MSNEDAQAADNTPAIAPPTHLPASSKSNSSHTNGTMSTYSSSFRRTPVSVAVDPVALITTECITVTSAMRKHARWAHSSVSAILGGSHVPMPPNSRPGTPRDETGRKGKGAPRIGTGGFGAEGGEDGGLANRWGLRGKKGKSMQDNPLMAGFGRLRRELAGCRDIHQFDTPSLLHPFLQVIQASATSAPITSLALVAITKFFSYNLISPDSPRLSLAMQSLSAAITHCRFEASDSAADEIVLLRILKLMEGMLSGPGGDLLSDESVCEMMETGLSMCCQSRLSELLRRSAEISMVKMCQVIFERLKHLEIEAGDNLEALDEKTKEDMFTVKMDPSANANDAVKSSLAAPPDSRPSSSLDKTRNGPSNSNSLDNTSELGVGPASESSDEAPIKPYSLPSIRELFRVLVDLLDPHDKQHADAMRVMALRIIDVALEVAGPSIAKHPSLATLAEDRLCRYLFQLVRSDNMAILHESLIVAGTLLATCRGVLKLQQELFLSYLVACLHPRVEIPREPGIDPSLYAGVPQAPKLVKQPNGGAATPVPVRDRQKLGMEGGSRKPDAREAMVESVGALARIPSFMVELYVNYDCEVDRADLCEDMVGLLSRNAIPDSATWSTTSVPPLCLDALLGYIQFVADRLDDEPEYEGYPEVAKLREQRRRKKIIIQGASKFNESPKAGLAYLSDQGIIDDPTDAVSVARFLKGTTRISKKMFGEFIAKKGNEAILEALMSNFDFAGKRLDEALRVLLETFRLPGESALIERIITVFSEQYIKGAKPEGITENDAIFVLTYAIIMLNVDQHSPKIKAQSRMQYEDFAKQVRGVNGGQDFDPEFLRAIFEEIKSNEIILPDEHDNKFAFDYAWRELLLKTGTAGELVLCDTNIFDADMFAATWKPVVATLSYVFMSASDDAVFSRVINGFDQCARIAAKYGLTEAVDKVVYCLSYITSLATESPSNTTLNTEIQVGDNSVMVSELAVKLGRDFKAQLATVVLFRVVTGSETVISDSWKHIVRIWLNLFVNSLIPPFFAPNRMEIPPIPLQNPSQVIDRGQKQIDTGLFSAFTSYISSYAADDPPEPSDEELESTLCTVDCVNACHMGDVFANVVNMPVDSLKPLVEALLSELPDDPTSVVISVKPETEAPVSPNGPKSPAGPLYDPSMVYLLELVTVLALKDKETVAALGADVGEALQNVMRNAASYHSITIARTMFYLLHLLHASYEHSFLRVPVVLHTISSFKKDLFDKSAPLVLQGLNQCIDEPGPLRNEIMTSPDFWVILRNLTGNAQSAPTVFKILEEVAVGSPPTIMADNYESAVKLLNDFASAGSVGSTVEQKKDRRVRKGKGEPQVTTVKQPQVDAAVARGVKAIQMIYSLTTRIPVLMKQSHLESKEAWAAYWSPIFRALTTQCTNPCREIRHQAFSSLQRTLLSPELTSGEHEEWTAIFGEVLFPLIVRLLKPEVYSSDPVGMSETRVQAATLLCKIFLHYLVLLSKWEGMLDLWLKILDIMDRLMNSGQGDSLEEAVPESLKNILLVMSSSGYLVPPSQDASQEKLWTETWKRIDRFLPDLRKELDLDPKPEEVKPVEEKKAEEVTEVAVAPVS
ncbi:Uncharacterized protein LSUB1_G004093 [Lachnellula subtilissima]|uniref:SEC7 domain-containing protein n=1 Tax=Lachnellula subtilissima TaxID=602034 RepID=A0A8H8UC88_9HELO|nr:Uncharacterized protein LSUB1_G004093 [Lachnellula subtilissima]